ncbi:unnamed protein product [Vitrella brassicaformis CCMP3155]|uniref:Uncharacterized protein n=1 Tax=Vitrella brassicaformis (strain CCMP3155) TaxID=1169540 RepID=A0A0G4GGK4_VITBC|nr:unnamed protein product [Vitrella brassicaformis CCMP3155]|eukprot:CEM28771.1 unnamed protein product [Vitrella brassicaformis CCMP3155]
MKAFVPIGSFCSPFPFPPSRINVWVLSYPSLPDDSDRERVYCENRDDFNIRCNRAGSRRTRLSVRHAFDGNPGSSGSGMIEFRNGYWWLRGVDNAFFAPGGRCQYNIAARMTGRNSLQVRDIIARQSS